MEGMKKRWTYSIRAVLAMALFALTACAGSGVSNSGTSTQSGPLKVAINGTLENGVAKIASKTVGSVSSSGTVTAVDAMTGSAISTAADIVNGQFGLTFNLPTMQSVVVLMAKVNSGNTVYTYRYLAPIDLGNSPAQNGLSLQYGVSIVVGLNSDSIVQSVSADLGLPSGSFLGDAGIKVPANKTFADIKTCAVKFGGSFIAYGSSQLILTGTVQTPVAKATYTTTATPYQPQQNLTTYSQAPAGFSPVYAETVMRHGSRTFSSFDASPWTMWQQAAADGALTPLGAQLGADVWKMMKATALLDYGVAGVSATGAGNLTQLGINEAQQIGTRLYQRLPAYFARVAASKTSATPRQILYVSSGVNRATDTGGFFTKALMANYSSLKPLIVPTAALTAYPAGKPAAQAAGINRFLLYFHKLAASTDLVTDPADPYYTTYTNSLLYQAYLKSANLVAKQNGILTSPAAKANALAVLQRLFTQDFINKIDNGTYTFGNTGTYTFTSNDGKYTATVTAGGGTTIKSLIDAANELYSFYVIAPEMAIELDNLDFTQYIPDAQASYLAYLDDVGSYYQKGPGITEDSPITFTMSQILLNDFFNEVDAIAKGNLSHGAVLRFTHAEEIIPFATMLGLQVAATSTPNATNYTYDNNTWRGSNFGSGANVQWDVYNNASGTLLVRMLYNEQETDFKPGCDSARYASGSHFYNYNALKACYNHVAN